MKKNKRAHRLAVSRAAVGTARALRCHTHNFVTLTNFCHVATKVSRSVCTVALSLCVTVTAATNERAIVSYKRDANQL